MFEKYNVTLNSELTLNIVAISMKVTSQETFMQPLSDPWEDWTSLLLTCMQFTANPVSLSRMLASKTAKSVMVSTLINTLDFKPLLEESSLHHPPC